MSQENDQRWCGEVTNELRHVGEHLEQLDRRLQAIETQIADLFARHMDYHAANEHRWGLVRWAHRYPIRFALLVAALFLWLYAPEAGAVPGLLRHALAQLLH